MNKPVLAAILAALSISAFANSDEPIELHPTTLVVSEMAISTEEEPKQSLPNFLTQRQAELLQLAHRIGKEDNHKNPELLQGILMQETKAGQDAKYLKPVNRCYGIFQIKIGAARHVLRDFPELIRKHNVTMTDKAIIQRLIHDDEFNTSVASKYLLIMQRAGYSTMKQLALAYNQGAGGAKLKNPETFHYSMGVMKHIRRLQGK